MIKSFRYYLQVFFELSKIYLDVLIYCYKFARWKTLGVIFAMQVHFLLDKLFLYIKLYACLFKFIIT